MSLTLSRLRRLLPIRQKRTVLAFLLAVLALYVLGSLYSSAGEIPDQWSSLYSSMHSDTGPGGSVAVKGDVDIASERIRSLAANPGYINFGPDQVSLEEKCNTYFSNLNHYAVDLEAAEASYDDINPLLYRKDKWLKKYRRDKNIALSRQRQKFGKEHEKEGEVLYNKDSLKVVEYERKMVHEFNHMRVFGKCLGIEESGASESSSIEHVYREYETKVYPWLDASGGRPVVKDSGGKVVDVLANAGTSKSKSLLRGWQDSSKGKGIVVPLLNFHEGPNSPAYSKEIHQIGRLLRTLSELGNKLPIQVVSNGEIDASARDSIVRMAHNKDANSQEVSFVDISPVISKTLQSNERLAAITSSSNFALGLATIFNSFEEMIVLTYQAIPVLEDFTTRLFSNQQYISHGSTFFKKPSYPTSKLTQFPSGFFEVANLMRFQLTPSEVDIKEFGLHPRTEVSSGGGSKRVLEDHFQDVIDSTVMVLNKKKVLSGLLLGCTLQFYKILNVRFYESWPLKHPEFLWLGQEMAGINPQVNFNVFFGCGIGILTPQEKKPYDLLTTSEELCSSSWGQIDGSDEYTLLYITSHQAENWESSKRFRLELTEKFTVPEEKSVPNVLDEESHIDLTILEDNVDLYVKKIEENCLRVNDIMLPPTINVNSGVKTFVEPNFAWLQQKFDGENPYWCAYDVVGKPERDTRGQFIKYNDQVKESINRITNIWLHAEDH